MKISKPFFHLLFAEIMMVSLVHCHLVQPPFLLSFEQSQLSLRAFSKFSLFFISFSIIFMWSLKSQFWRPTQHDPCSCCSSSESDIGHSSLQKNAWTLPPQVCWWMPRTRSPPRRVAGQGCPRTGSPWTSASGEQNCSVLDSNQPFHLLRIYEFILNLTSCC